jgi:hypothetical protein
MNDVTENSVPKQRGRPFTPGVSGNPKGKPKGARNHVLLALDKIGAEGAEAILKKAIEQAIGGDQRAAELILSRVWPARKGRPVHVDLPDIDAPSDLIKALAIVAQAVASGAITPAEGQAVAAILETQRRAVETAELAARIEALEAQQEAKR